MPHQNKCGFKAQDREESINVPPLKFFGSEIEEGPPQYHKKHTKIHSETALPPQTCTHNMTLLAFFGVETIRRGICC